MIGHHYACTVNQSDGIAGRYIRFRMADDSFHPTYPYDCSIFEIECYESADGTGTNLCVGKSAIASTIYNAIYAAGRAIDQLLSSRWASVTNPATYQWIYIDFGSAVDIGSVKIKPYFSAGYAIIGQTIYIESSSNATDWNESATIYPTNSSALQEFLNL